MEGATMREIAEEAGFANGALKPYFPTKDLLLTSAFGHVFNRTNQRIATMTDGLSGVAALRAFCAEVLPLDEERVNEARIVIPFWQKALNDAEMLRSCLAALNAQTRLADEIVVVDNGSTDDTAAAYLRWWTGEIRW